MSHDIKKFKPRKNSRYVQGTFNPASARKLFESQKTKPIIYRSSWERRFIIWLENSSNVKRWGNECIGIPYISPLDNKQHVYYPDFIVEFTDGTTSLIEVKPHSETIKPTNMKSQYAVNTYVRNVAKWKAANYFCQKNGIKFSIITEHTIDHLKINR